MMPNCWEAMSCGREPGGLKSQELGVCPAATAESGNGINGGRNSGRICWAVAGTLCGGEVQGSTALKQATCLSCRFFAQVREEEGSRFHVMP